MDVERIAREVVDLHAEFERWFDGSSSSLDRVEASLAPGFVFCGTGGDLIDRDAVLGFLRPAYGRGHVTIGIDDVRIAWRRGGLTGATYVEVHTHESHTTRRRSSCVLEAHDDTPGGLRWLAVHETWIDPPPAHSTD